MTPRAHSRTPPGEVRELGVVREVELPGEGAAGAGRPMSGATHISKRHPGARRQLLRRSLWPPPPRHRLHDLGEFEREILRGCEGIKPGWVRINFNYFIAESVFDYLLEAVHLVADEGWKLLPQYVFEPLTGQWRHRSGRAEPPMGLDEIRYDSGRMEYRSRHATEPLSALAGYLAEAREIFAHAAEAVVGEPIEPEVLSADFEHLRWFPLPSELQAELEGRTSSPPASDVLHVGH